MVMCACHTASSHVLHQAGAAVQALLVLFMFISTVAVQAGSFLANFVIMTAGLMCRALRQLSKWWHFTEMCVLVLTVI
jgi:hypothetical protein